MTRLASVNSPDWQCAILAHRQVKRLGCITKKLVSL